jgi:3-deoxy-manno-octulosonate cytidylyltransferase (CMP-KDO synthetase)
MRNSIDVIGIIPARYESSRLPHKLLRQVLGKPLIQWSWEAASKASLLDDLIIACDDVKIKETAESFGAKAILTSTKHQSGTDRIAEAVRDIDAKIIINIQADEPLMHHSIIDSLAREMINNPATLMATVKKAIDSGEDVNNPNIVKVISDKAVLQFIFHAIPYIITCNAAKKTHYKHMGITLTPRISLQFQESPSQS